PPGSVRRTVAAQVRVRSTERARAAGAEKPGPSGRSGEAGPERPGAENMVYATRPMHDADSHIMEPPAWLEGLLTEELRARLPVTGAADAPSTQAFEIDRLRRSHESPEYRADDESQI